MPRSIDWSQKVAQERKLKIVLMTIAAWITNQEEWQAKETSLRRLGDYIVRQVYTFDETFSRRSRDPMRCQLGRFLFPKTDVSPGDAARTSTTRFKTAQANVPTCELCVFRGSQRRSLLAQGVDLYSPARTSSGDIRVMSSRPYVLIAAEVTTETAPQCRWCERLGDAIIALHAPQKALLVTA